MWPACDGRMRRGCASGGIVLPGAASLRTLAGNTGSGGAGMGKSLAACSLFLLVGGVASAAEDVAVWKGRKAADALTGGLQKRIFATMNESGPTGAIAVCAYQAEAIEGDVAKREGVTAKRTSLRIRNPKNAPDDYEKGILERFVVLYGEGNLPEERIEFREMGGVPVYRYTKPILVDDRCLACHGESDRIPEDVRMVLDERYPDDRARGYRKGDFRGIVSVVIPKEQAR